MKPFVIAIDGRAASGKGTISARISSILGASWLNTGILYRKVAFAALSENTNLDDNAALYKIARNISLLEIDEPLLYTSKISKFASIIAAKDSVRAALMDLQRSFPDGKKIAVIEGRDIGTIIFPDADIKIFVTASLKERAKRRFVQLQNRGEEVIYNAVLEDLEERDKRDEDRGNAPLKIADGSVVIDTTNSSVEESVNLVLSNMPSIFSKL